jgi:hypothetical protein
VNLHRCCRRLKPVRVDATTPIAKRSSESNRYRTGRCDSGITQSCADCLCGADTERRRRLRSLRHSLESALRLGLVGLICVLAVESRRGDVSKGARGASSMRRLGIQSLRSQKTSGSRARAADALRHEIGRRSHDWLRGGAPMPPGCSPVHGLAAVLQ